MAKRQHVIELNGQKYDALTGKVVTVAAALPTEPKRAVQHVDGFVRRKSTTEAPKPARISRQAPATKVHQKTEKSKTLMRSAVKKPNQHKITAKVAPVAATKAAVVPTPTIEAAINRGRVFRANAIAQSTLIRKFNTSRDISPVKTAVVPVQPVPGHVPAIKSVATPVDQPAPTASPFDVAIELANSHFQPKIRKVRGIERIAKKLHVKPRTLGLSGLGLVLLAVGSFWAYQYVPNVAMRVATARSGVSATLPAYHPSGFNLAGPITAVPGQVSINYKSNSDNRKFQVVQRSTDWNSQSLLSNFVNTEHQQYQSMQVNGRTIYLYDNAATWVDGGVWYQVKGDNTLSRDQILRLVDGL